MRWNSVCVLVLLAAVVPAEAVRAQGPENIAAGAACTFSPAPNYTHCTDPDDAKQLTDGQYVQGHFWTQPGTVGWSGCGQVIITLDLGADKPISGLSFSTAAGAAGVSWPKSIAILTAGEDGLFHDAGDLVALSAAKAVPPPEGYANYRFTTEALHTHARRVALVVFGDAYIFCDEIEVYKGDAAWVNEPLPGAGVADVREHTTRLLTRNGVKRRITVDIAAVRKAAEVIPEESRKDVNAELDAATAELDTLPAEYGPDFKTILPLNPAHAKVFSALAKVWRERGLKEPVVWAADPWYRMELCPAFPGPSGADATHLHVDMMQNETRSVAFNMATVTDAETAIDISGLPADLTAPCIEVRSVAWTDTRTGDPVAAALLPVREFEGSYYPRAVPGLVQQVWLTVNSRELTPGTHNVMVKACGQPLPLTIQVYPFRFPDRPTLHMGGWDYTNLPKMYEATEKNRAALVKMLREYFVDSPWGGSSALPFGTYEASGAMTAPPGTANFDAWRRLWPDARQYCVFAAVSDRLDRFPMGTPEFDRAVGAWAQFWAQYMRGAGLDPEQLMVLLVDEPYDPKMDAVIAPWARAIHASGAGIRVWEDPTYSDMARAMPEMVSECDVLCPNRPLFHSAGEGYRAFFAEQRAKGRALEFYSCSGPMRLLDPYTYCRLQGWDCWRYGAVSSYFWAFADGAGCSSWNEYPLAHAAFTPLFIDAETVVAGKHLEAMREGVEDYEYLVMLDKALKDRKGTADDREDIRAQFKELVSRVCAAIPENGQFPWKPAVLAPRADAARVEILQALLMLEQGGK